MTELDMLINEMQDTISTTVELSTKELLGICLELKEFREYEKGGMLQGKYILPISNMRKIEVELEALREVENAARNEAIFWNEDLCAAKESDERDDAIEKLNLAIKNLDEVRKANERV